jgi:hypothetical protein
MPTVTMVAIHDFADVSGQIRKGARPYRRPRCRNA